MPSLSRSFSPCHFRPKTESSSYPGLRPFQEYAHEEAEAFKRPRSAVNSSGELWEPETLQLRVTPPEIYVDNDECETETKVTVCSANRPGTLVEVVSRFTKLGLAIKRARISSDSGWFADDFYVTEPNGDKVTDPEKIETLKRILSVDPITEPVDKDKAVLEIFGEDRLGLLSDINEVLTNNGYVLQSATVWTEGLNVAFVVSIFDKEGRKNLELEQLCTKVKNIFGGENTSTVVRPVTCRGQVHDDHRLHFMLLESKRRKGVEYSKPEISFCQEDDKFDAHHSPKLEKPNVSIKSDIRRGYWIIHLKCKDRLKLMFDAVCTLADLDFDVYHGSLDCGNGNANLELFVRPRFQHLEAIEDKKKEIKNFLKDAIVRRFPKGLKLHVQLFDDPACLADLLSSLKASNFCVTRAKLGRACLDRCRKHTIYVMNSNGTPPTSEQVADACHKAGGKVVQQDKACDDSDYHRYKFAVRLKPRRSEKN